jgi:hypothetical protein
VPADPSVRPILIRNRWRSAQAKDQFSKRELWRYLARKVAETGGFVVFHYDGDTRWSKSTESPARAQFDREVRIRVAQVLSGSQRSPEEISQQMGRIIECVPFYSVEVWTYQATARAIALCREKYRGADVEKFEAWGADRTKLDDEWKPKEQSCLRDEHNEELGKHVPVWKVAQAGCSMMGFVWSLHACGGLLDALAFPDSDAA